MIVRPLSIFITATALITPPSVATALTMSFECAGQFFGDEIVSKFQKYSAAEMTINDQTENMALNGHVIDKDGDKRTLNIEAKILTVDHKPPRSPDFIAKSEEFTTSDDGLVSHAFQFRSDVLAWRLIDYRYNRIEIIEVAEFFCSKPD